MVSRGASFLKICIPGIFDNISSNLRWDSCQKPPNFFLLPGGGKGASKQGAAGGQFLNGFKGGRIPSRSIFLVKNLEIEQFQLVSRKSKKISLLYYFRTKKYVLGLSLLKFRLYINKTAQRRKSDMVYLSFNSTSWPTLLIKIHFKSPN